MDRTSGYLLSFLSLSDLENLIQTIVRRVLRTELQQLQTSPVQLNQADALLATFGTWEDKRSAEEIVADIYASRTDSSLEAWP
ncbi:MAG: hypothetical protein AAF579_10290 [Cyanobacteria bacterium P01_C01_bin.118]